jgi:hypothetical protein
MSKHRKPSDLLSEAKGVAKIPEGSRCEEKHFSDLLFTLLKQQQ